MSPPALQVNGTNFVSSSLLTPMEILRDKNNPKAAFLLNPSSSLKSLVTFTSIYIF